MKGIQNLRQVELMIESEKEFDYSLMYGDVSDLMLTVDVKLNVDAPQDNFKSAMLGYAKHLADSEVIVSGRMTGDGYRVMIGTAMSTSMSVKPMTPVQFIRYRLGDDAVHGKAVQLLMKEYAEYYHNKKSTR